MNYVRTKISVFRILYIQKSEHYLRYFSILNCAFKAILTTSVLLIPRDAAKYSSISFSSSDSRNSTLLFFTVPLTGLPLFSATNTRPFSHGENKNKRASFHQPSLYYVSAIVSQIPNEYPNKP